jgi:hypothetical protein
MASGTDGNIISYDTSGNPVAVATGTDGQVLTSAGAGQPPAFEDGGLTGVTTGSGNVTITNGNLILGTSGKGIDFSATSDAGGMTAELLDDYEEGTWTPTFDHDGAVSNVTINKANYTKVGRLVYVSMSCRYTGSDLTGENLIGDGLPFTSNSGNTVGVNGAYLHDPGSGNTDYDAGIAGVPGSNTTFYLIVTPGGRYQQRWLQNYYLSFACWYFV